MSTGAARRPKGYVGTGHVTLGIDILAVLSILKLPEQVLGEAETKALRAINATEWYPVDLLLRVMEVLSERVGHYGLVRMGRKLFKDAHEETLKQHATSARDVIYGLDAMYRQNNRGDRIGGWKVLSFGPGIAELEKNTPHHCAMEQGILAAALAAVGCPVSITQRLCFREGEDTCVYSVTSVVADERWVGGTPSGGEASESAKLRAALSDSAKMRATAKKKPD